MVDRNFYAADESKVMGLSKKLGWDKSSLFGDPMFVDPANANFRIKDESPALKVGFKNFSMNQFGVKKPSLKAIARTPEIPAIGKQSAAKGSTKKANPVVAIEKVWLGATLQDLAGVDFSAYGVSKEEAGVALTKVPVGSAAAKAGLLDGDLIQAVNGRAVSNIAHLLKVLNNLEANSLKLKVVRNQALMELKVGAMPTIVIESSSNADGFKQLKVPAASGRSVSVNQKTGNEPLSTLNDGKLAQNFGPVFSNGTQGGAYKMDLGSVQPVSEITSWSHRQGNNRVMQKLTIYGSNSTKDPGWNLKKYTPLASIETGGVKETFAAASLRAPKGKILGNYRWIVWAVSPISAVGGGENTAFQEFFVKVK